jgi:hypothetical protein
MSTPTPSSPRSIPAAIVASLGVLAIGVGIGLWSRNPEVTIGVEGRRTVEIAGPQLTAAPFTPGDALAVRIAEARPVTGGYEYDLRFMGFGPGEHDMAAALRRPDGSPAPSMPELRVQLEPLIPEDYSGELYAAPPSPIDLHSNYTRWMTAAWVLWAALLLPLAWYGHKRRRAAPKPIPPPSVIERLRALLQQATREHLSPEEQADVEQLLLAFWSERLQLSEESLGDAIEQLRRHPQAGAQWSKVERWLHSPHYAANGAVARELLADLEGAARR